jgi:hypothetical protein
VDVRQIVTGNAKPDGLSAGGEEQRAVAVPAAVRKLDLAGIGMDRNDASAESQLDLVLAVELGRAQRHPFLGRIAGEVIL